VQELHRRSHQCGERADPDPILDAQYGCGSSLNLNGYCDPEVDKLIEQQSREGDPEKRKPLLWARR